MELNEHQIRKRFEELSRKAYTQSAYCFTDFISVSDAALLYDMFDEKDFGVWGGADGCERVIARFGNAQELGYEQEYPIDIIKVSPLLKKFADDLTHRDFLGALMNLGIERDVTGDIVIRDKTAYIFVAEKISDFIISNLDRVKHTSVRCEKLTASQMEGAVTHNRVKEEILTASQRLDAVIAGLYNLSRNQAVLLFRERRVFINGRLTENNSGIAQPDDVIAVRGYGKFIYCGITRETKKGRLNISVEKYI